MNRTEKILHRVKKDGQGLEIGPGHSPVAPRKDGYKVHILDHLNQNELVNKFSNVDHSKYKNINIDTSRVESVDFVWSGETYLELTQNPDFYDWIIASHVIEHTPDLIAFLNDCDAVLKEDGILSLVVPDKRFCFDRFRPLTGISKIIDANYRRDKTHSPGTACEYFLNVVSKGEKIAWGNDQEGKLRFLHSIEEAIDAIEESKNSKKYLDFHAWCFTPSSFRLMIEDLNRLGLIQLKEICYFPSGGFEFFITLGRKGKGIKMDRIEVLERIETELSFEHIDRLKRNAFRTYRKLRRKIRRFVRAS